MNRTLITFAIIAAGTLGACGPTLRPPSVSPDLLRQEAALQREYTYKMTVERRIKLSRIYTPLRIANADICGQSVSPVTGITGIDGQSLDIELRAIAQRVHGLSDGIKILDIVPESPASQAGLLPGDVIAGAAKGVGVVPNGWTWNGLTILDLIKVIESSNGEPITLLVRRGANTFPLALTPRFGYRYPIELKADDSLNAHADGTKIVVHTGTFNHVPDDRQLAFLIAHELAHNILEHVQKMQGNAAAGAIAGAVLDIGLAVAGINTGGAGKSRRGSGSEGIFERVRIRNGLSWAVPARPCGLRHYRRARALSSNGRGKAIGATAALFLNPSEHAGAVSGDATNRSGDHQQNRQPSCVAANDFTRSSFSGQIDGSKNPGYRRGRRAASVASDAIKSREARYSTRDII